MNISTQTKSKQSGAALVISMVLLMVLTILAISTMRTASLEVAMAGNDQYTQNAFQLAETGIDEYMAIAVNNGNCADTGDAGICNIASRDVAEMSGSYQASSSFIRHYDGCPGGYSIGTFASYHFEVQATGQTTARSANDQHDQGWLVCRNQ